MPADRAFTAEPVALVGSHQDCFLGSEIDVGTWGRTGNNVETASRRIRVDLGQKVRVRVEADHAEEVHVHGYDLKGDVAPGQPAVIDFTADVPGVFEVELEESSLKLLELQVQ